MNRTHFPVSGPPRLSSVLKAALLVGAVLAGLLISTLVSAEEAEPPAEDAERASARPPVYQPAGAPADPKVDARWNFSRDYEQATALLKKLAEAHPDLCRLESLGKSHGGRDMWLLKVTNFKTLPEKGSGVFSRNGPEGASQKRVPTPLSRELERPAFWIDGGIHANEVQAVDVVLYTAWFLAETYGRQDDPPP